MTVATRTLEAIKAAPLSQVIEHLGGGLKRVGHEFLTQCPWHDDTNPSLTVNDQKGFCFCHIYSTVPSILEVPVEFLVFVNLVTRSLLDVLCCASKFFAIAN